MSKGNNNLMFFMQSSQQSLSCGLRLKSIYLYLDMPRSAKGSQECRESINACTIINTSLASTAQAALVQPQPWERFETLGRAHRDV